MWALPGERSICNFSLSGGAQFGWMSCCSLSLGRDASGTFLHCSFSRNLQKRLGALLLLWNLLECGQRAQSHQGDWKLNASNETKQSQKPVSTKQRRLNISFACKQVLWLCGKFRGYFFAVSVDMPDWNSCKQYQYNKENMCKQIHANRAHNTGKRQHYLAGCRFADENWKVHLIHKSKEHAHGIHGCGSESWKLNKETAREDVLWVWPRTASRTWQPVGCNTPKLATQTWSYYWPLWLQEGSPLSSTVVNLLSNA